MVDTPTPVSSPPPIPTEDLVDIVAPDGRTATVARTELDQAKQLGFVEDKRVDVISPDGKGATVLNSELPATLALGFKQDYTLSLDQQAASPALAGIQQQVVPAPEVGRETNEAKLARYKAQFAPQIGTLQAGTKEQTQLGSDMGYTGKNVQDLKDQAEFTKHESILQNIWGDHPIPVQYRKYLRDLPEEDWPIAKQALDELENQHPDIQIADKIAAVVEELAAPGPAKIGELSSFAARGIIDAAGIGGKGILKTAGQIAVKAATDTVAFSGPEALKNVLVDKDPDLATENIIKGAGLNLIFHGAAELAGPVINAIKNKGGTLTNLAADVASRLPGGANEDRVAADFLRERGASDTNINDLPDKVQTIKDIDQVLPEIKGETRGNLGKRVRDLGPEADTDIKDISKQLTDLSTPDSKTQTPEGVSIDRPESEVQKQFVDDIVKNEHANLVQEEPEVSKGQYIKDQLDASKVKFDVANPTSFEDTVKKIASDWEAKYGKPTLEDFKAKQPEVEQKAIDTFNDIKTGKLSEPDFIDQRIKSNPKVDPAVISAEAKTDFDKIREYAPETLAAKPTNVYDARVNGNDLLSKVKNFDAIGEQDIVKDTAKTIEDIMDKNGKIAPDKMDQLSKVIKEKITAGVTGEDKIANKLYKNLSKIVDEAKMTAESRIAAGSGKQELMAKLENARLKNKVYNLLEGGTPLLNKKAGQSGLQMSRPPHTWKSAMFSVLTKPVRAIAGGIWNETGKANLLKSQLKYVSEQNVVSHLVIDGAAKHKAFLDKIPQIIASANNIHDRSQARKDINDYDGLKTFLGEDANGLSKSQQYDAVVKKVNDPTLAQKHIDIGAATGDNNLAQGVTERLAAITKELQNATKQDKTYPVPFAKNPKFTPTQQQLSDLNDVIRLTNNPDELLNDYKAGLITPEKVALIQRTFPASLQYMRQTLYMEAHNIDTTYQNRIMLGTFLGQNLDPSLNNVGALQAVNNVQTSQPKPGEKAPKQTHSGSKEGSASYATPNQQNLMK